MANRDEPTNTQVFAAQDTTEAKRVVLVSHRASMKFENDRCQVEPNEEEQFDGRWRNEFALKGIVKVEHGQHYGPVKVEDEQWGRRVGLSAARCDVRLGTCQLADADSPLVDSTTVRLADNIGDEVVHFYFDIFMASRDEPTNTQVFAAQDTTEAMCVVLVSHRSSMKFKNGL
ncbi:hypothetical protein GPALN_011909 [Globodera pallida]|nr:hypothetical protein GPALN_011909 [Globodera pallida]